MTTLELGYTTEIERYVIENQLNHFEVGRVMSEHKERYVVSTEKGDFEAEITGKMRYTADSRLDFPAVGDWVAISIHADDAAIIHHILPRSSVLSRKAVNRNTELQIIAVNIDYAFIVQAFNRDFNINRLERYLTICYSSNVRPIIVLTKSDLIEKSLKDEMCKQVNERIKNVPVLAISNFTSEGPETIKRLIESGKSYCLLGSSGAGKSTLLNALTGWNRMRTATTSNSTAKGRHTTTHRELFVLENGGIIIDTPGMREIGITDTDTGIETTFDYIASISKECKYANCTHTNEKGCAVLAALDNGEISAPVYGNYRKLLKEKEFFESSLADKRKKDKMLGKIIKHYKNRDIKNKGLNQ